VFPVAPDWRSPEIGLGPAPWRAGRARTLKRGSRIDSRTGPGSPGWLCEALGPPGVIALARDSVNRYSPISHPRAGVPSRVQASDPVEGYLASPSRTLGAIVVCRLLTVPSGCCILSDTLDPTGLCLVSPTRHSDLAGGVR
jgi:hypothetical protein